MTRKINFLYSELEAEGEGERDVLEFVEAGTSHHVKKTRDESRGRKNAEVFGKKIFQTASQVETDVERA